MTPPAAGPERAESAGAAFRRGLLAPGGLAISLALAVGLVPFGVLAATIDEEFVAGPSSRLLAIGATDTSLQATSDLVGAMTKDPARPRVWMFGPSSIRNSVDGPRLASALGGVVANGTSGGQGIVEALGLIDAAVASGARGVVVLGIGPGNLSQEPEKIAERLRERPPFGIRSKAFDDFLAANGTAPATPTGNYFFDNRRTYLPRVPYLLANAVTGPSPLIAMPTRGKPVASEKEWRERTGRGSARLVQFRKNGEANMVHLAAIADRIAAAPDLRLVLVQQPRNPRYIGGGDVDDVFEESLRMTREFAAARKIPFLEIDVKAALTADDFYDGTHLRTDEGINRYTDTLAAELVALGLWKAGGK